MRKIKDWLAGYLEYTEDTEPAKAFQTWTGLSMISAALRKKTSLTLGRLNVYANMYIVFVAEPGIARKSQAIDFGVNILSEVPEIITSADATTKEAILEDLEKNGVDEQMPDGSVLRHSSLSIISREFESFLGQKKDNTKMLVLLTDLFDCKELPWKYRTKHSGSNAVPSVYLNLLAATTPDSIASCLPATAIGGGLTSRILFVWADKKYKKCAIPELNPRVIKLRKDLVDDLYLISRITGPYTLSKEAYANWTAWYNKFEERDPSRICKDPSFTGWYSRKPMYILKVAMVRSACISNDRVLNWSSIEEAIALVESTEQNMGGVFRAVGRSQITYEVDLVMQIIRARKYINEKELMSMTWRDIDAEKFDNVIGTAIKTGVVKRVYQGPKGEKGGIWYVSTTG